VRDISQNTTRRKRLPNRRRATTLTIEDRGLAYTTTFGHFADGNVGEVFLQNHKPGSQADSNAAAVAASLALQYGCPLEVLRRALLRDSNGRPSTPLGVALDAVGEGER
jgi:hypothetical protein